MPGASSSSETVASCSSGRLLLLLLLLLLVVVVVLLLSLSPVGWSVPPSFSLVSLTLYRYRGLVDANCNLNWLVRRLTWVPARPGAGGGKQCLVGSWAWTGGGIQNALKSSSI
jgi:hypothetical protein